jgi:hypothetical protein
LWSRRKDALACHEFGVRSLEGGAGHRSASNRPHGTWGILAKALKEAKFPNCDSADFSVLGIAHVDVLLRINTDFRLSGKTK